MVKTKKKEEHRVDQDDPNPLIQYLQTESGHELASRIVDAFEENNKATHQLRESQTLLTQENARFTKYMQVLTICVVVTAVVWLSLMNRFEPSVGILLGTLAGYAYGRRS